MRPYSFASQDFAEDSLPPGQEFIRTRNYERLEEFMEFVLNPDRMYPLMVAIVGHPGIGKSVGARFWVDSHLAQTGTGLPDTLRIKVRPHVTDRAIAIDIGGAAQDKVRSIPGYEIADEVADIIDRNGIKTLFFDEADRFNLAAFEVVRRIHDKKGCTVVFVGLPDFLDLVRGHDQLSSRIALRLQFEPFSLAEMRDTILPNLRFPRWEYHDEDRQDVAMATTICKWTNRSFRDLRTLLENASILAAADGQSRITLKTIEETRKWMLASTTDWDFREIAEEVSPELQPPGDRSKERESEARHAAKACKSGTRN